MPVLRDRIIPPAAPQASGLYRAVALVTRFQLGARLRTASNPQIMVILFAAAAGVLTLGTITVAALMTKLPLLFPPLAPSAFILFYTPMAMQASPRSVVLSHTLAVLAGLLALGFATALFPSAGLTDPGVMNWARVLSITLAVVIITVLMAMLNCTHPPAAASALIGAMGYLAEPIQALGLIAAAILLALEAILLNRAVGGLPYPLWRADMKIARNYRSLAGLSGYTRTAWQELAVRMAQRR